MVHVPNVARDDASATDDGGDDLTPAHTRTAAAFVSVAVGMAVAVLMLVFVVQNSQRVTVELLWIDFTLSAGVALLASTIAGGLVVAMLGLGRVLQLRLAARRHRSSMHRLEPR